MTARPEASRAHSDHQAFCHSSDEEFLALAVPFLQAGLKAGEPALVSLEPRRAELVYEAVTDPAGLTFVAAGDLYARPASVLKAYRKRMADYVAAGASDIRIVGELPPVAFGYSWDWWARYESAVNHAYAEFPVRTLCAYDTRVAPPHVLDDVRRTHPVVTGPDGVSTKDYIEPRAFLTAPWPVSCTVTTAWLSSDHSRIRIGPRPWRCAFVTTSLTDSTRSSSASGDSAARFAR